MLKTMNSTLLSPGYVALKEHAAWMDLSERGKIRLTGDDRKRLLHAMTTNQVQKLEPGEGCYAFFLNAQGRILGDANIFVLADSVLLDTEPETRQKLKEHLDRYIIADDVTLQDETSSLATIALEGPEAEDFLKQHAAPVPHKAGSTKLWGNRLIARASSTGAPGFLIFAASPGKRRPVGPVFSVWHWERRPQPKPEPCASKTATLVTAKRLRSATWCRKPANCRL